MAAFAFGMYSIESYVFGEKIERSVFQIYAPSDLQRSISDFGKESSRVTSTLEKMPEVDMGKVIEFAEREIDIQRICAYDDLRSNPPSRTTVGVYSSCRRKSAVNLRSIGGRFLDEPVTQIRSGMAQVYFSKTIFLIATEPPAVILQKYTPLATLAPRESVPSQRAV